MRRRKIRRLINRYGLKAIFKSPKVKLDYRDLTLGQTGNGSRSTKGWESWIFLFIIILGLGMVFYSLMWPNNVLS